MFKNKLLWQMFFTAGFAAISASVVIYITVQLQLSAEFDRKAVASLDSQLAFARVVASEYFKQGQMPGDAAWLDEITNLNTRLSIIDISGEVLFDSKRQLNELDNHKSRPEILQAMTLGHGESRRFSQSLQADLRYMAERLEGPTGPVGVVRVSSLIQLTTDSLTALRQQLLFAIFSTLLVLFGASYLLARRFYQPIKVATAYAQEIAEGNYQLRLPGLGVDEVARLERSLNGLARKTEERLARVVESRNQVTAILSGLKEGVIALDSEERIAHINQSAIKLLSLHQEILGKKIWEVLRIPKMQSILEDVIQQVSDEQPIILVDGRTLEVSIETLGGAADRNGLILVFHNITERSRLDQMRTDFVANASHELKTPLSAIKGMVETIIDDPQMPTEISDKFMRRVLKQSNRLHQIVLDLMQLSRFDNYEQDRIPKEPVDMVRTLRQVCAALSSSADEGKVNLEMVCDFQPIYIMGEAEALAQLLSNLVENAVKYSPAGSEVKVTLQKQAGQLVVQVVDKGIGIPRAEQKRVFERFYRVDTARSRELGGTGLGLSIVKHIAEAHDASVVLSSEVGKGSTFTAKFPLAETDGS